MTEHVPTHTRIDIEFLIRRQLTQLRDAATYTENMLADLTHVLDTDGRAACSERLRETVIELERCTEHLATAAGE